MTRFTLDASPLLPWPVLIALVVPALIIVALAFVGGQRRSAILRGIALLMILGSLANPSFVARIGSRRTTWLQW